MPSHDDADLYYVQSALDRQSADARRVLDESLTVYTPSVYGSPMSNDTAATVTANQNCPECNSPVTITRAVGSGCGWLYTVHHVDGTDVCTDAAGYPSTAGITWPVTYTAQVRTGRGRTFVTIVRDASGGGDDSFTVGAVLTPAEVARFLADHGWRIDAPTQPVGARWGAPAVRLPE